MVSEHVDEYDALNLFSPPRRVEKHFEGRARRNDASAMPSREWQRTREDTTIPSSLFFFFLIVIKKRYLDIVSPLRTPLRYFFSSPSILPPAAPNTR